MPEIDEWKSRKLQPVYPFIFMDAVNFNVRVDGHVNKHAVYVIIGITTCGEKEILGFWIGKNESAAHWAGVLNNIKSRGVEDILLFCADGLSGLKEAINTVYPGAVLQRCIVHQLRNTFKHFSYRDLKEIAEDMKKIYKAANEKEGYTNLQEVSEKWGHKHAAAFKSWFDNWDVLSPFYQYPAEVRTIVYTTNIIEGLNRQFRRVTKRKNMFPNERALEKMLYLCSMYVTERWKQYENWDSILTQMKLLFPERLMGV
jgi:transposase-like protein